MKLRVAIEDQPVVSENVAERVSPELVDPRSLPAELVTPVCVE